MKFSTLVALMLSGLLGTSARATSVVILASPTKIVVAADSMVYGSREKICKVFKIGSVYWAVSGDTENTVTGYNVPRIVQASYTPGQGVVKTRDRFMKEVIGPLTRTMNHLVHFPQFDWVRSGWECLEIAFWGFEEGKPIVAQVRYKMIFNGKQVIVSPFDVQLKRPTGNQAAGTFLGVRDKAGHYAMSHQDWAIDSESSAFKFISLSIEEAPDKVGPPISELEIYPNGIERRITTNDCCKGTLHEGLPPLPKKAPQGAKPGR
jgi:hypothetical protein